MTATSQLFVGTGASATGIGTVAWTNPGNITASDDTRAVCTLDGGLVSNYLNGTNPNPTLARNSYITGVTCKWEGDYFNTFAATLKEVGLIINGARVGTAKTPNQVLTASDVVYTYGSSTDMWGLDRSVINAAAVNLTNSGFYSYCQGSASGASRVGVDAYSMIFDYILFSADLVGGRAVNRPATVNAGLVRSY
jgi:hypothetical protein